ncbi:MAG: phosphate ABC transporter ATP-binding protein [Moorea sp. SIO1G6]|uniref:phosphate ABC transporter ATP-binding protein n=1 Tax=Moorena sp. SIO1G6 TaxID=2607840 RepID=UPI0013C00533|nr:phosphate ABC transporter ATP-binding protein [Moorena sp. SIO1G6]NET63364.1 phosphate ABC transporter ATP-binding protein [Moorena sp. SIO1G6]
MSQFSSQAKPVISPPMDNWGFPTLCTDRLSLYYGSKQALDDITLSIPQGSITALIGPSGCGKTSFLYCLNRLTDLIPNCLIYGNVWLGDSNILHPKTDTIALRRRIGMVLQKPNPFPFSIWKNIAFPLKEHGIIERRKINGIVERVLTNVKLWDEVKDRLTASALRLSGGQKQRLCIARTLALAPEIILMDEPCSALDPISSGVVEDLIASLRGKYTVVIVTHNLAQARRIADYVGLFWVQSGCGRLIEFGPVEQIFQNPQHSITAEYINGQRG